ncbi:GNAT family N-acetyltransferase [Paenibacillus sp. PK3_47]|nr:GNAT family N-acetyltransferase [Paenibacillus sp. PK3_47]
MWPDRELDYVKLKDDDKAIHYGLYEEDWLVSVVSLFIDGREAQFRKFATAAAEQGKGYGTLLLNYMLGEAERSGVHRVICNARSHKAAFYQKFGLIVTDRTFTKGGKEYIVMERFFGSRIERAGEERNES